MKKHLFSLAVAIILATAFTACSKGGGDQNVAVTGVTLNQTTATLLTTDPPLTLVATVTPDNATDKNVSWTSGDLSVATVAGGVVTPVAVGTANITVTTEDGGMTATCVVTVSTVPVTDAEGVVIGGIKWARRNVGAPGTFASAPEDPGMFYQWNSATGWSATDPLTSSPAGATWSSTWDGGGITTNWESANDPCPTGWRVSTQAELALLIAAGSVWTTIPAAGCNFGSGSNIIFLPAAGNRTSEGIKSFTNSYVYCWSATLYNATSAYFIYFYNPDGVSSSWYPFAWGLPVRCVAK